MTALLNIISALLLTVSAQSDSTVLLNAHVMKSEDKWRIVNDGVMGGLSSSTVSVNDEGKILFGGNVSLKNNGGFASLRSPIKDYKFEKYSGIEISIKGDGKKYSISMKETSYFIGSFYTVNFQTTKDEWITLKIPFTSFALYYFGKEVRSNPQIPLNKIKEIALLIGEKQEGTFNAEIDFMKLY
ncbi:MAG: CIA30 family protein [Melioribacteraceae bacterium]|nr:CIA30 family protein [Melioribacteraceae bacterium]